MLTDDLVRSRGLDDDEFEALDTQLQQQRKELGRLLSQGKVEPILPAMRGFIHLLGADVELPPDQERQVGYKFLEAVVQTPGIRLEGCCEGQVGVAAQVHHARRAGEAVAQSPVRRRAIGPPGQHQPVAISAPLEAFTGLDPGPDRDVGQLAHRPPRVCTRKGPRTVPGTR
ncbi:MAG: hypothetical protein ACK5RW_02725 [bacterium]